MIFFLFFLIFFLFLLVSLSFAFPITCSTDKRLLRDIHVDLNPTRKSKFKIPIHLLALVTLARSSAKLSL